MMGAAANDDPLPEITNVRPVTCFEEFVSQIEDLEANGMQWVYRGQAWSQPIETSLERVLRRYDLCNKHAPIAERYLIEEFRRHYFGADAEHVRKNKCYCLALMRHHRAPTRLLDWTYSAYVAAKFALDSRGGCAARDCAARDGVVWCLNTSWLDRCVGETIGEAAVRLWNERRDDASFNAIFCNPLREAKFVYTSNPFVLNPRLSVQQGLFISSGNASYTFIDGLKGLEVYQNNVVRLRLELQHAKLRQFAASLLRAASLFPGLDGLAASLGERLVRFCWEDEKAC
jgi:FRG domain